MIAMAAHTRVLCRLLAAAAAIGLQVLSGACVVVVMRENARCLSEAELYRHTARER